MIYLESFEGEVRFNCSALSAMSVTDGARCTASSATRTDARRRERQVSSSSSNTAGVLD